MTKGATTAFADAHRLVVSAGPLPGRGAFFVDRDGTLIEERNYLADPDGVALIDGAVATLRRFRAAGFALVLITNQSGIGSGRFGWPAYEAVAERLRAMLATEGLAFDAEAVCGHAPAEGAACGWRKPAPGMLTAAGTALGIDFAASLAIGDKLSDIEAAAAAGLASAVHVLTGHGAAERAKLAAARPPIAVAERASIAGLAPA
ncbi:MAG: HAD-IIIA family hydrolase [Bauldia sp.]